MPPTPFKTHATAGLLALLPLLVTSAADADIRIWEEHPDSPRTHRTLDLTGYLQPGYIWRQDDPEPTQPNPNQDNNFWVQRVRLGLRAKVQQYIWFRMEYDARVSQLQDAYIDVRPLQEVGIRFGQFKLPFLKTMVIADDELAFNDRAIYTPQQQDRAVLRYLNPRDVGVMLSGKVGDTSEGATAPVFEYGAGMFLGQGPNASNNIDNAYLWAARTQLHLLGIPDGVVAESDLARNQTPRVAVAGGVYTNCDDRGQWNRGWTTDAEFRYEGLYASGTFVWFKNGAAAGLGDTLAYDTACGGSGSSPLPDHIATGGSAQVQYVLPSLLTGEHQSFELLTRFDQVNPQSPCNAVTGKCSFFGGDVNTPGYVGPTAYGDSDNPPSRYRLTFGVNYFPSNEQNLRFSLNYMMNRETEDVQNANGTFAGIKNDVIWFQATAGI